MTHSWLNLGKGKIGYRQKTILMILKYYILMSTFVFFKMFSNKNTKNPVFIADKMELFLDLVLNRKIGEIRGKKRDNRWLLF